MKKALVIILAVIIIISIFPAMAGAVNGFTIDSGNKYEGMAAAYGSGISFTDTNNFVNIVVPIIGNAAPSNNITASIEIISDASCPFVYNSYVKNVAKATHSVNDNTGTAEAYLVDFSIPLKSEHYSGRQQVTLLVDYVDAAGEGITEAFPLTIDVISGLNPNPTPEPTPEPTPMPEEEIKSMPKVIMSNYRISPDPSLAGGKVSVDITLKNSSKSESVKNMVVNFKGETTDIIPISDTGSVYIDSLGAEKEVTFKLDMNIRADAKPEPQKIILDVTYEDSKATPIASSYEVLLQIKQPIRTEYGDPNVMASYMQGDSASFSFAFYNLGKNMLYNVRAEMQSDAFTPDGSAYLGNMESGTNKNIDIYATATGSEGPCEGKIVITYEDEYGEVYTEELPFTSEIMPPMQMDYTDMTDEPVEEQKTGMPWWIWIIIAGAAIAVVAVIVKKRKVKKEKALNDELLADDDEDDDEFN